MENSYLRGDNHFIRVSEGWVLIDGSWFESLNQWAGTGMFVRTTKFRMPEIETLRYTDVPEFMPAAEHFVWEKVWWHPGVARLDGAKVRESWSDTEWLMRRWKDVLHSRYRHGWRLMPDGKLPDYVYWEEMMAWNECLQEAIWALS
jgi:hypothetical protein